MRENWEGARGNGIEELDESKQKQRVGKMESSKENKSGNSDEHDVREGSSGATNGANLRAVDDDKTLGDGDEGGS